MRLVAAQSISVKKLERYTGFYTENRALYPYKEQKRAAYSSDDQQQKQNKHSKPGSKPSNAPKGKAPIPLVIDAKTTCSATFHAAQNLPSHQRLKIYAMF